MVFEYHKLAVWYPNTPNTVPYRTCTPLKVTNKKNFNKSKRNNILIDREKNRKPDVDRCEKCNR